MSGAPPVPLAFHFSPRNLLWLFLSQRQLSAQGRAWTLLCPESTADPGDQELQLFSVNRELPWACVSCPQQGFISMQRCTAVGDFNVSPGSFQPIASAPLHPLPSLPRVTPAMCDQKTWPVSLPPSSGPRHQLVCPESASFCGK